MDENLQKLILAQKKDDTKYVKKQTFSAKTSVTLGNINEEHAPKLPSDFEKPDISDFKKETLLRLVKFLDFIEALSPREKIFYLANSIGRVSLRDIEKAFKNPVKRSMIGKIISEVREEIEIESEELDKVKNISSIDRKRIPRDPRAKYF